MIEIEGIFATTSDLVAREELATIDRFAGPYRGDEICLAFAAAPAG